MKFKITKQQVLHIVGILFLMWGLSALSNKLRMTEAKENIRQNQSYIDEYLQQRQELIDTTLPILWIHINYEKNIRHGLDFDSPTNADLNMPFINMAVRSIINKCGQSFKICIIDDTTFGKILPSWNIDMTKISSPVIDNVRSMGLLKILYHYGGMLCPKSFLCQRNLLDMYNSHEFVMCDKLIRLGIGENNDLYMPDIQFCSVINKKNSTLEEIILAIEIMISKDQTTVAEFNERIPRLCDQLAKEKKIYRIGGKSTGIMKKNNQPVLLEDLLSDKMVVLDDNRYGIWIPEEDVLHRKKFTWFATLSEKDVLNSDLYLCKQFLLTLGEDLEEVGESHNTHNTNSHIMTCDEIDQYKTHHVGHWQLPLCDSYYGLKPSGLGNNIPKTI
jgi:hypothetical protein